MSASMTIGAHPSFPLHPNSARGQGLQSLSDRRTGAIKMGHNTLRDSADGINNCTTLTAPSNSAMDGTSLDLSSTFNGVPTEMGSAGGPHTGSGTRRFSAMQEKLLTAGIQFFHRHIRTDNEVLRRMKTNDMFQLFYEPQYYDRKPPGELNAVFINSVSDPSAVHVSSFILSILHQGLFSVSAFIVSIIYLSRFKEATQISLHASTAPSEAGRYRVGRAVQDKPVRNSSLAKLFPVLSNAELNRLENKFLLRIRFNVQVKSDLFTSFCEKLLQENISQEIVTCVSGSEYAAAFAAEEESVVTLQHPPPPKAPPLKHHHQQPQQQQQHAPVVAQALPSAVAHAAAPSAAQREPSRGPLGHATAPAMDYFLHPKPGIPVLSGGASSSSTVRSSSIPAGSVSARVHPTGDGPHQRTGGYIGGLPTSSRQYTSISARQSQPGMAGSHGRPSNIYDQRIMYHTQQPSARGTVADPTTSRVVFPASTRASLPAGLAGGHSHAAPSTPTGSGAQSQYAVVNTPTGPQYVVLRPSAAPAMNPYSGRSSIVSQDAAAPRRHSIGVTAVTQRPSTPTSFLEGQSFNNVKHTIHYQPFAPPGAVSSGNVSPAGNGMARGTSQNRPHSAPRTVGMYKAPVFGQQWWSVMNSSNKPDDLRRRWASQLKQASEADSWGQILEAQEGYRALAVDIAEARGRLAVSSSDQELTRKIVLCLSARLEVLSGRGPQRGSGNIAATDIGALEPVLLSLFVAASENPYTSPDRFPVAATKFQHASPIPEEGGIKHTSDFNDRDVSDFHQSHAALSEVHGTVVAVRIEGWGLKDAQSYVDPITTVSVVDPNQTVICSVDTHISKERRVNHVLFQERVYLGVSLEEMQRTCGAIFFEFKHYKPKKKKVSTRCWSFMELEELKPDEEIVLEM
ncbi:hypothetical protein FOL47_005282 [Perkinsus chesapeaki]|uniref:C2 Aida-type domain-containing protein n=1 Tax=Perkinsus chesapeaki TaxID=330153 RepID=A0A7J6LXW2_PERCH|nr:hypothetical protein FOL47_005282 [Perkinsus chesapeaki]